MYTLVVVDMQTGFRAAKHREVGINCLREINKAVEDKADIIFLEYFGHNGTLPKYRKVVKDYPRVQFVGKSIDDGSEVVQQTVDLEGYMMKRFRVVGINTDWCVLSTVRGMRKRFPNSIIEVVADACDSNDDHYLGLVKIRKIPRIDILYAP